MSHKPDLWVIIPAAGVGKRFAAASPKQYQPLLGKTVLEQTLARFEARDDVVGIVLAVATGDQHIARLSLGDKVHQVEGGAERCDSVRAALTWLAGVVDKNSYVAVHDAARPCVRQSLLDKLFAMMTDCEHGVIPAQAASDTIKQVHNTRIEKTLDRQQIYLAQTPQVFRFDLLYRAMQHAQQKRLVLTDDASAVEAMGGKPSVLAADSSNIKITVLEDLALAAFYLETLLQESD